MLWKPGKLGEESMIFSEEKRMQKKGLRREGATAAGGGAREGGDRDRDRWKRM